MSFIQKPCLQCGKQFDAPLREIKRGNGKFCSRKCSSKHRVANMVKPEPNVECSNCGVHFYKNESKKKNSKSGLFFCSRTCKDQAQRIGGIKEIMPDHYGTGRCYRSICWSNHDKECVVCGEKRIVAVHHYDENHDNNDPKNLIPLCPTHHCYVHSSHKHLVEKQIEDYLRKRWG